LQGLGLRDNQVKRRSAELAILDYLQDEELTVFTALDGEDFYEYTAEDFAKLDSHAYLSQ
jgi:hypothetical protein